MGRHFGRHSTPSSDSAICSAETNSAVLCPSAACLSPLATYRHASFSRDGAGKCRSISVRTSFSREPHYAGGNEGPRQRPRPIWAGHSAITVFEMPLLGTATAHETVPARRV